MKLEIAKPNEFLAIRDFYWEVIDLIHEKEDTVAWIKGVYPADSFIKENLEKGQLYVVRDSEGYVACLALNSDPNKGYNGINWGVECEQNEVIIPHALVVHPSRQNQGIGKLIMKDVTSIARSMGKKVVRLDILDGNYLATRLYESVGFKYIESKDLYYEDTGWAKFHMYELIV